MLSVQPLKAFGKHQPDTGQPLGCGAVLARRALAVALAGHGDAKATLRHGIAADRVHAAAAQAGVGKRGQAVVVVRHDVHRCDLIGGDVVAQGACVLQRQALARQLCRHALRVTAEVEDRCGLEQGVGHIGSCRVIPVRIGSYRFG
jgi:hypothetical protein